MTEQIELHVCRDPHTLRDPYDRTPCRWGWPGGSPVWCWWQPISFSSTASSPTRSGWTKRDIIRWCINGYVPEFRGKTMKTNLTTLFTEFFESEQASGIILIVCTLAAIVIANSSFG